MAAQPWMRPRHGADTYRMCGSMAAELEQQHWGMSRGTSKASKDPNGARQETARSRRLSTDRQFDLDSTLEGMARSQSKILHC